MGGDEILPRGILPPYGCRRNPVPAQDVSHRLIGDRMAQIGQCSDDAVVSPAGVLSGEADDERFQVGRDTRAAGRSTEFGAVELAGNEAAVPGEDGIGFGDKGDLLEGTTTEPLADLSESGSLGIGKAHSGWKLRSQDAILSCEVFILEQPGD